MTPATGGARRVIPKTVFFSRETDHLGQIQAHLRGLTGYTTLAYELIQNADDARASQISFDVRQNELVVENDELFTDCGQQEGSRKCPWSNEGRAGPCDFHSFRWIAGGAKREREDTTGAFGVGFIAVYQVTDKPELVSSGRHWTIDEMRDPGQRIAECPGCPRCRGIKGTRFYLPWAFDPNSDFRRQLRAGAVPNDGPQQLLASLSNSLPASMLFLRHLDQITIAEDGRAIKRLERVRDGSLVIIDDDGDAQSWLLSEADFDDRAGALRERYGDFRIEPKRQSVASVAIPLEHEVQGLLCAYLPTEQETGLPFHVNADFFTSPDRKRVLFESDYQSQWNSTALTTAGIAMRNAVPRLPELLGAKRLWRQALTTWRAAKQGERGFQPAELEGIWREYRQALLAHRVVLTSQGPWELPSDTHLLDVDTEEAERAGDVLAFLGFHHVHSDIHPLLKEMRWRESLQIQAVTLHLVVEALRSAGLTKRIPPSDLPSPLDSPDGRDTLWGLVWGLIAKRPQGLPSDLRDALSSTAIGLSRDGALEPLRDLHRASRKTVEIFEPLGHSTFVASEVPEPASRLFEKVCPTFDAGVAIRFLEEADRSDLEDEDSETLLRWFDARSDEILEDSTRAQRLAQLSLYPSSEGLRPLTELALPGGFDDPLGLAGLVDVERVPHVVQFLRELGATELTLERYVQDFIPAAFRDGTPVEAIGPRVVEFLARHLGELKNQPASRLPLASLPLVLCTDGRYREPGECYFQNEQIARVLGLGIPLVDTRGSSPARADLFRWLGVADKPRATDVLATVARTVERPPSRDAIELISGVFEFLAEEVQRAGGALPDSYTDLRTSNWLPVDGDPSRWWSPSECYAKFFEHLFASQARFLAIPVGIQRGSPELFEPLGIRTTPEADQVVSHILNQSKAGIGVSSGVYDWLNQRIEDPAIQRLEGESCLWVGNRYLRPDQVFWDEHPFGRYRSVLGGDLRRYAGLFELLGVRASPDFHDAVEVLLEMSAHFSEFNELIGEESDQSVVYACWKLIERALEDGAATPEELTSLRKAKVVPDRQWLLRQPSELLIEDLPNVADKFESLVAQHLIPSPAGMTRALAAVGVGSLDDHLSIEMVELEGVRPDQDVDRRLSQRKGELQRVIETELGSTGWEGAKSYLEVLRSSRVTELVVQFTLSFAGGEFQSAPEATSAHLAPREARLYIAGNPETTAWPAVARELARAFVPQAEDRNRVASSLLHILAAPSVAGGATLLDELGYPRLEESKLSEAEAHVAETIGEESKESEAADAIPPGIDSHPAPSDADRSADEGERAGEGSGRDAGAPGEGQGDSTRVPRGALRTYVVTDEDPPEDGQSAGARTEIELAGVAEVVAHEEAAGRIATIMPPNHPGYDIESRSASGEIERLIEVKSLSGAWDLAAPAAVTRTQFRKAQTEAGKYWLYVVENALTDPRLYRIQNPAQRVTQFLFDDGWNALAEPDDLGAADPTV